MREGTNTSSLQGEKTAEELDSRKTMVKVDGVSMIFNMANEQLNSLKEYAIALARREFMFKEFRALDNVSFEVKKGDVFGILGTNGSGKSTMLKIIAGVLEPSEGSCVVNGNIAPLIELGAGFDMELTARENIYLNGALLGYSKKFIQQHFDEIVEFAEVEDFLDMPMKNYSSGMVARIAFAIATVIVPDVLIVDEVLSVGDFMFQQKCENRITRLIKEHNVTVLIVSHNNDQIERLCNKAVWIEKGHVRMMGSAKDVCQTYRVLGGRVGSKESEDLVFKTLISAEKPKEEAVESLTADTRYGIAAKLMERCYPDECERVILVSGERYMSSLISSGLAGAMDAPMLLIQDDNIPDATAQELKRLKPKSVVLVDNGIISEASIADMLRHATDMVFDIVYLSAPSFPELSVSLFEYGIENNCWGDEAVLTFVDCTGDLVSLSPYIHRRRCPVFLKGFKEEIPGIVYDAIKRGGFTRILLLGGTVQFPEEYVAKPLLGNAEVVRFCGKDHYDANEIINDWIDGEGFAGSSLVVSPIWNTEDSLAAGLFASKLNSNIIFDDPQDLDSVAHAIRYIEQRRSRFDKLLFVGDRLRFSKLDKELLAKALQE